MVAAWSRRGKPYAIVGPLVRSSKPALPPQYPELIPVHLRSLSRARHYGKPLARKPTSMVSPALSSTELHPPRPRTAVMCGAWSSHRFYLYRGELFGMASSWSALRHGRQASSLCVRSFLLLHAWCSVRFRARASYVHDVTPRDGLAGVERRCLYRFVSPPSRPVCGCALSATLASRLRR
jgi:hypothetical protein